MHIEPTDQQLSAFAGRDAAPEPVYMLNLLRFRDEAEGMPGVSGLEAYLRYAAATEPHLARVGAEVQWAGACDPALIGPGEPEWDVAALVRYPSRAAFLDMVSDADYLEGAKLRSASLTDSRLIPCAATALG